MPSPRNGPDGETRLSAAEFNSMLFRMQNAVVPRPRKAPYEQLVMKGVNQRTKAPTRPPLVERATLAVERASQQHGAEPARRPQAALSSDSAIRCVGEVTMDPGCTALLATALEARQRIFPGEGGQPPPAPRPSKKVVAPYRPPKEKHNELKHVADLNGGGSTKFQANRVYEGAAARGLPQQHAIRVRLQKDGLVGSLAS